MINIVKISIEEFEYEIYSKYKKIFPSAERRKWSKIKKSYNEGIERFYKVELNEKTIGFIMLENVINNCKLVMKNDYDYYAKDRHDKLLAGLMPSHRFVEKPMMKDMIEDLSNKKVLMLGCGTGEESIFLKAFGAKEEDLIGIDLSKKSIELAKKSYPNITFIVGDMSKLPFEDNFFDYIYSSLAIHYSPNPEIVYKEVYRVLKPNGKFLFSLVHPIRWASFEKEIDGSLYRLIGCSVDDKESTVFGSYNTFKEHTHTHFSWGINETLSFYVGSPSFHFKLLRKSGFEVLDFTESKAIEETKKDDMNYYIKNSELPQFMAFLAIKK